MIVGSWGIGCILYLHFQLGGSLYRISHSDLHTRTYCIHNISVIRFIHLLRLARSLSLGLSAQYTSTMATTARQSRSLARALTRSYATLHRSTAGKRLTHHTLCEKPCLHSSAQQVC